MIHSRLVLTTADYDCDGVSYGMHAITVPATRYLEFLRGDVHNLMDHAVASGQLSGYYDCATNVTGYADFLSKLPVGSFERSYFIESGYCSDTSNIRNCEDPFNDGGMTTAEVNEFIEQEKHEADMQMIEWSR